MGKPTKITTAKAQYRFRVFHSPITQTDTSRLKGSYTADGHLWRPSVFGFELNYNDHLFSLPGTTEAFVDTANRLAFGEALLYVNSRIYFIVVWLVEEGFPIDRQTAVTVLTPWQTNPLSYSQVEMLGYRNFLLNPQPWKGTNHQPYFHQLGYDEGNFLSYGLTASDPENYITDPFIALDVARETESGKARKQWFRGVLGWEDYYFTKNQTLKLLDFGSAVQTRFAWFQATMETMQWTHSAYEMEPDGSIKESTLAYTNRVANLAVDAAQQRRMFIMRSGTLQKVYRLWWDTCRYVSHGLRWIELAGFPEHRNLDVNALNENLNYPYALCPTVVVDRVCNAIAFFLNVLAIAQGSNVLAAYAPGHWNYSQETVYKEALAYLNGGNYWDTFQGEPIAELEESISWESIGAIQDLLGAVYRRLYDYARVPYVPSTQLFSAGNYPARVHALFTVAVHNAWASQYQATQGHLQAMFSLLFTWQFQFQPYEPTRNSAASDVNKTIVKKEKVYKQYDADYQNLYKNVKAPSLQGRINEELPRFAPFRTWSVTIPMPDANVQYETAARQAEIDAYNAKMEQIRLQREAQAAARKARHELERQALLNEINSGGGANPLDPWDHRNWSRKEYWLTPMKADDIPAFVSNALDTPGEIDVVSDVFNLSPRVQNGLKRLEPGINAIKDVVYPHRVFRRGIKSTLVRRVVIRSRDKYKQHAKDEAQDKAKERVFDALDPNATNFEPRDFWPDDDTPISPENPPVNPFSSSSGDFGGGESGGGGGELGY